MPEPKGDTTAADAAEVEQANGREPAAEPAAEGKPAAEAPVAADSDADDAETETDTESESDTADADADADADAADDGKADGAADASGAETDEADADDDEPAPNKYAKTIKLTPGATLPKADIPTGEFTPHGIGGAKRPSLKKTTKSGARLRAVIGTVAAVAVIAAGTGVYLYIQANKPKLEAIGAVGKAPKVTIPSKEQPAAKLQIKSLVPGSGPAIVKGDLAVVNFVGYTWQGKKVADTYKDGQPQQWTVGQLLPGLDKGITGQKAGGRVMLTIPPGEAFGAQGNSSLGVAPTDTLVFVIDVIGHYNKNSAAHGTAVPLDDPKLPKVTDAGPGKAPTVTVPKNDPPSGLEDKTLIEGTGPAVRKGQALVAQYEGRIWKTGKVFDSSWTRGAPAAFPIGTGKVIPGWDKALVGKKVGSRVLLVVPPKEGYGKSGAAGAGIKGTDTLVFVIDIVGAH
ncbi:MAG TPA: FKBP-type peptidyl-prolyl cis-trans isomerase [Streptosporangiaceae bacterium]|nr:FKBP-type peptidyl-prolyl cis-trans isomerase [Streptosporangiaceae bacterium]